MVETVLPLAEAREAHELTESGHAPGKIVLKVAWLPGHVDGESWRRRWRL